MARKRGDLAAARIRALVEARALQRCEYCHAPQLVCGYHFHVEHILPRVRRGSDDLANRALACAACNLAKSDKVTGIDPETDREVALFHPRVQAWADHFRWEDDQQTLLGLTPVGRATVEVLRMNSAACRQARQLWFQTGWLP